MLNDLVSAFLSLFSGLEALKYGKELIVFIMSLLPLLELRGGLIAAGLLNLNPWLSYFISIIGNILPVPLILLFINKIISFLRKKGIFKKFVSFVDKKVEKNKPKIDKYGYWGLVLFVGIPLPGTGAWTGCLLAAMLEMNRKKAFLAILLGVVLASVIMMILSFGILNKIVY